MIHRHWLESTATVRGKRWLQQYQRMRLDLHAWENRLDDGRPKVEVVVRARSPQDSITAERNKITVSSPRGSRSAHEHR